MMDNEIKKRNLNLITQVALRMIIAGLVWIIFYIILNSLRYSILNWVYSFNVDIYNFLNSLSWIFNFVLVVILFSILVYSIYKLINQILEPIQNLDKYIEHAFRDTGNNNKIVLPQEFKNIEDKINKLKYDSIKNEQIAKEAENRKNDLVVYLAHDLKTPLTSVIGYLTLLSESKELPEEYVKKYVDISLKKSERLEELINEFFEITRFNLQNIKLAKEKANLTHMINQLLEEFYPMFQSKNIEYSFKDNANENLYIYADTDKLARVFDNLLRNAINYSYVNTKIDIIINKSENEIVVSFRNVGDKIQKDKLEKIFEKFYRLDSARASSTGGAGLGLAISKEIVELHGGKIDAISTDEYTEFTVYLPVELG